MAVRSVTRKEAEPSRKTIARAGKDTVTPIQAQWWNSEDKDALARNVFAAAQAIERSSWQRRTDAMVFRRYLTGREYSVSYNFSTVQRPSALFRAFQGSTWRPPQFNAIATAADVFSTRIFKNRPFIEVLPLAAGGFKARIRAKRLAKFSDAVFEETKFWNTVEEMGIDAMATGLGCVKVHEDQNNPGHIAITRVDPDEILISQEEANYGEPHSMLQRTFWHRSDLIARYGKNDLDKAAIARAPSVYPAFTGGGDYNYKQIVPLIEGWSKPLPDGTPGRHVLMIPGRVLVDEPYTKRFFPFAFVRFKQLPGSYFGQGLVEQTITLQAALNRTMACIDESQERVAWPHVAIESGSNVSLEQLAGVPGGAYVYTKTKPVWETPPAVSPELYQREQTLIALIFKRAGISEAAAGGVKPQGINSGAGLMAWAQIDDSRHVDLAQRLEDTITQVAKLVFAVAEDVKPKVVYPGKRGEVIDWKDARLTFDPTDLTSSEYNARAFAMSRLPQTIAGREQQLQDWLANGQISRENALRAGLLPDIEAEGDLLTAARDDIDNDIDKLIDSGTWSPPLPFQNLELALPVAQSRYLRERSLDTPEDRLRLLLQWISCVKDLGEDMQPGNTNGAPAPAAGMQAPAGPAPAPAPSQIVPAQAPPVPLAA